MTTLQLLARKIEEKAACFASSEWSRQSNDVLDFLSQKGISIEDAKIILDNRNSEPPNEFIESAKTRIIVKLLEDK
jgi:hypothetical protein